MCNKPTHYQISRVQGNKLEYLDGQGNWTTCRWDAKAFYLTKSEVIAIAKQHPGANIEGYQPR